MTATINLTGADTLQAGSTFRRVFTLVDENGDPFDFTGHTGVRAKFRLTADTAGAALISLTPQANQNIEGCFVIAPTTAGQVQVLIDAVTLLDLSYDTGGDLPLTAQRSGSWDMEATFPDNGTGTVTEVVRIAEGVWTLSPEVTR